MGLRLKGGTEVVASLKRQERVARPAVVMPALFLGGGVIADEARMRAPRRTGNLAASIVVTTKLKFKTDQRNESPEEMRVYIGPAVGRSAGADGFYGHMVEFGTIHMAAQPFLRPAFDAAGNRAMGLVAKAVAGEIKKQGR